MIVCTLHSLNFLPGILVVVISDSSSAKKASFTARTLTPSSSEVAASLSNAVLSSVGGVAQTTHVPSP